MVRAEAQDQVSVRAGSASAGQVEARSVEAPDPAVLVEDRREGKEHQELERVWTSYKFEIVACAGCMRPSIASHGVHQTALSQFPSGIPKHLSANPIPLP